MKITNPKTYQFLLKAMRERAPIEIGGSEFMVVSLAYRAPDDDFSATVELCEVIRLPNQEKLAKHGIGKESPCRGAPPPALYPTKKPSYPLRSVTAWLRDIFR